MPTYADPALVAQLSQQSSFYVLEAAGAGLRLFAEDVEITTGNVTLAGAEAVARRMAPFGRAGMGGWTLALADTAFEIEPGQTIGIEAPGEWDGQRSFFVSGVKENADTGETLLKLIGGRP